MPLVPEASREDLEKIALELSAAEPRPYPDASMLDMNMSAPSTSGSEGPSVPQDDASVSLLSATAILCWSGNYTFKNFHGSPPSTKCSLVRFVGSE
jgi:hypothetical protein